MRAWAWLVAALVFCLLLSIPLAYLAVEALSTVVYIPNPR